MTLLQLGVSSVFRRNPSYRVTAVTVRHINSHGVTLLVVTKHQVNVTLLSSYFSDFCLIYLFQA